MKARDARRALGAGLLGGVLALGGCEGRPRSAAGAGATDDDGPAIVELDLSRGAPEVSSSSFLGPISGRTFLDLVGAIRGLHDETEPRAIFVRLGGGGLGLARAGEVGRLLGELRDAGRTVVCHSDDFDNARLLLASAGCSSIWVSPAGGADAVGIAAQLIFAAKLLEKLHVEADFLQIGKYKGASEPFTRDAPSPEARESLETALRGVRAAWIEAIRRGRGNDVVGEAAEDGPYPAIEAKARGLVDEIGYADEAREEAKKRAAAERVVVRFGAGATAAPVSRGVLEIFRSISGAGAAGVPHVAVVRAVGAISMSAPTLPFGSGGGITERELGRVLARVADDESAKAVVLRIDSPGGSALASDLLWKKLMTLRGKKPLVVSIGGMAASGGYYLASAGTRVVAEPTSIIGSMGVVGGKLAFDRSLEQIGVHVETVAANPEPGKAARAAYASALEPWDEPTRARMLASMQAIYDLFLRRVAEGRGTDVANIAASAEGRLFGGVDAKARGLVDELGGLDDALHLARELGNLAPDAPFDVVGDKPSVLDWLGDEASDEAGEAERALARRAAQAALAAFSAHSGAEVSELAAFLGSVSPLASGERAVTALPFVMSLR